MWNGSNNANPHIVEHFRRPAMRQFSSLFGCLLAVVLYSPAVQSQTRPPVPPTQGLDIIFVVNGSGADLSVSENLTKAICKHRLALNTDTIAWCRWGAMIADHQDYWAQVWAAGSLAGKVADYHARWPQSKIYLIGHSAGCHVVLAAADKLPPLTIEGIVLLAPSVSTCYDLRPALRSSRRGIDCYFSFDDNLVSVGSEKFGTADGQWTKPAGEIGFTRLPPNFPDACLYRNLRHHRWAPEMEWTGHRGGHYGFTTENFLDFYVLPIMVK